LDPGFSLGLHSLSPGWDAAPSVHYPHSLHSPAAIWDALPLHTLSPPLSLGHTASWVISFWVAVYSGFSAHLPALHALCLSGCCCIYSSPPHRFWVSLSFSTLCLLSRDHILSGFLSYSYSPTLSLSFLSLFVLRFWIHLSPLFLSSLWVLISLDSLVFSHHTFWVLSPRTCLSPALWSFLLLSFSPPCTLFHRFFFFLVLVRLGLYLHLHCSLLAFIFHVFWVLLSLTGLCWVFSTHHTAPLTFISHSLSATGFRFILFSGSSLPFSPAPF